jgi:carbonic anhydrase/acetyltransferase-like protein (isoleucine patch superfamily)
MNGVTVYGLRDAWPQLGKDVYIAPTAIVVGDVTLGDAVSVWFGAVIRGDETSIRIGAGSNVQDGTIIHSNRGGPAVVIGDRVTIGHGARLHGCRVESDALIGIGAIVLDGAVVESGAIVAAGSLVPPGRRVAAGELWAGAPATRRRPTSDQEQAMLREAPAIYIADARRYDTECSARRSRSPGT